MMTYRELAEKLKSVTDEHLDDDVTIMLTGETGQCECFAAEFFVAGWEDSDADTSAGRSLFVDEAAGVLDDGHPYLTVSI